MSSKRTGGRKQPKGANSGQTGGFDKISAIRTVQVPVSQPGVYAFEDDVTDADRVWVEWVPSAALVGKARRCFLSKKGVRDPSLILTDRGIQLPRKGWSGDLDNRHAVVFGPGKFKIWIASERTNASGGATGSPLAGDLLALVSSGTQSLASRQAPRRSS